MKKKISDYVIEELKYRNINEVLFSPDDDINWDISVGEVDLFLNIYNKLKEDKREPQYFFENWKSAVIQMLKKDNRFECNYVDRGLRGQEIHIMTLKKEFRC